MINIKSFYTILFLILALKQGICQKTGNPYLDAKKSQSEIMAEENRKILAKQKKAYQKQMQQNKKAYLEGNQKFYNKKGKGHRKRTKKGKNSKNRI